MRTHTIFAGLHYWIVIIKQNWFITIKVYFYWTLFAKVSLQTGLHLSYFLIDYPSPDVWHWAGFLPFIAWLIWTYLPVRHLMDWLEEVFSRGSMHNFICSMHCLLLPLLEVALHREVITALVIHNSHLLGLGLIDHTLGMLLICYLSQIVYKFRGFFSAKSVIRIE